MPHGFLALVGAIKAAAQALDASGLFLSECLQASHQTPIYLPR
jgi:hypothetical protein